jgi:DNA primase
VYRLDGRLPDDRQPPALPVTATQARASDDVLGQVYGALLATLSLSDRHRTQLRQRGLSDRDITWRGYRTLGQQGRAAVAKRLFDLFGPETCLAVPGLYVCEREGKCWWSLAGASGLVIPIRDDAGRIVALTMRSDDPDADSRYSAISSTKYGGPGPGAPVHVPLAQETAAGAVRLTEGPLKADVATALGETFTIGLPGVSGVGKAIPLLRAHKVRQVRLAFDADGYRNLQVARALRQAIRTLLAEGFRVCLETWDEVQGKGIDDLFLAGHATTVLTGWAMMDELRTMVRSARLVDTMQIARRWEDKQLSYVRRLRLPMTEVSHGQE